jgi:hypothetical protein
MYGRYVNILAPGGLYVYRDNRDDFLYVDPIRYVHVDSYVEGER